jgi:hypothetical protein
LERLSCSAAELRYDVAYDAPAYDSGLKRHQLMFAADVIWFY